MSDNCKYTQAEYQIYSVGKASLLWCGVKEINIDYELSKCVSIGSDSMSKATLRHPTIKCLEPRMRAIFLAIDAGLIPCSRENGRQVDDYVAYDRRHVYGKDLKEWAKKLPNSEQPKFLMTVEELKPEISHDIYARLKAEYDTLKIEHNRIKDVTQNHNYAIEAYEKSLKAKNYLIAELEATLAQQSEQISNSEIANMKKAIYLFCKNLAHRNVSMNSIADTLGENKNGAIHKIIRKANKEGEVLMKSV